MGFAERAGAILTGTMFMLLAISLVVYGMILSNEVRKSVLGSNLYLVGKNRQLFSRFSQSSPSQSLPSRENDHEDESKSKRHASIAWGCREYGANNESESTDDKVGTMMQRFHFCIKKSFGILLLKFNFWSVHKKLKVFSLVMGTCFLVQSSIFITYSFEIESASASLETIFYTAELMLILTHILSFWAGVKHVVSHALPHHVELDRRRSRRNRRTANSRGKRFSLHPARRGTSNSSISHQAAAQHPETDRNQFSTSKFGSSAAKLKSNANPQAIEMNSISSNTQRVEQPRSEIDVIQGEQLTNKATALSIA